MFVYTNTHRGLYKIINQVLAVEANINIFLVNQTKEWIIFLFINYNIFPVKLIWVSFPVKLPMSIKIMAVRKPGVLYAARASKCVSGTIFQSCEELLRWWGFWSSPSVAPGAWDRLCFGALLTLVLLKLLQKLMKYPWTGLWGLYAQEVGQVWKHSMLLYSCITIPDSWCGFALQHSVNQRASKPEDRKSVV